MYGNVLFEISFIIISGTGAGAVKLGNYDTEIM